MWLERAYYTAMTDDSDLTPPSGNGQDATLDEFRALVRAAFEQALNSGKLDWQEMASAVLKNRLLNLTSGQFSQSRYGSPTFIHLVRRVPDLLDIVNDSPPFKLKIKAPIADQIDIGHTTEDLPQPVSEDTFTTLTEHDWRRARIRDDLWRAIIDYGSGNTYVLDPNTGLARPKASNDPDLPEAPTVTPDKVASWRHEFAESLAPPIKARFTEDLDAWADGRGRQSDLPRTARGPWAEFIKRRVTSILLNWFKGLGESPPKDMLLASESRSIPPSEAIDEVVQARQLRDYIIRALRAMTYEELAQIPLPASVLLHVSRRPGQDD